MINQVQITHHSCFPLDMIGLIGMAQVLATLAYGIKGFFGLFLGLFYFYFLCETQIWLGDLRLALAFLVCVLFVLAVMICQASCDHRRPCRSFLTNSFVSCKDRALERDRPYRRGQKMESKVLRRDISTWDWPYFHDDPQHGNTSQMKRWSLPGPVTVFVAATCRSPHGGPRKRHLAANAKLFLLVTYGLILWFSYGLVHKNSERLGFGNGVQL